MKVAFEKILRLSIDTLTKNKIRTLNISNIILRAIDSEDEGHVMYEGHLKHMNGKYVPCFFCHRRTSPWYKCQVNGRISSKGYILWVGTTNRDWKVQFEKITLGLAWSLEGVDQPLDKMGCRPLMLAKEIKKWQPTVCMDVSVCVLEHF